MSKDAEIQIIKGAGAEKPKETGTGKHRELETEKSEEIEKKVKKENNVEIDLMDFHAARPDVGPELEALSCVTREYCFIGDTLFSNLEDEHELGYQDKGSFLTTELSLLLGHPVSSTRSTRAQSEAAHDVLLKDIWTTQ